MSSPGQVTSRYSAVKVTGRRFGTPAHDLLRAARALPVAIENANEPRLLAARHEIDTALDALTNALEALA